MKTFEVTIQQKFKLKLIDGEGGALAAQKFKLKLIDGEGGALAARYIARNCIARQIPVDSPGRPLFGKALSPFIAEPGEVEIIELTEISDDSVSREEEAVAPGPSGAAEGLGLF